jgi:hypothetical protein
MAKPIIAQSAKEHRMARILAEAEERFRHELMDDEERQLLLDRIKRLRRQLARQCGRYYGPALRGPDRLGEVRAGMVYILLDVNIRVV